MPRDAMLCMQKKELIVKQEFLILLKCAVAVSVGFAVTLSLSGCVVLAVADAAATVAVTAVKVTAKTVGVAADIVLPSSDKKAEKDKDAAKK